MGCHFLLSEDLPNPGIEPVSPALAGKLFTTGSPGKPQAMSRLSVKEAYTSRALGGKTPWERARRTLPARPSHPGIRLSCSCGPQACWVRQLPSRPRPRPFRPPIANPPRPFPERLPSLGPAVASLETGRAEGVGVGSRPPPHTPPLAHPEACGAQAGLQMTPAENNHSQPVLREQRGF